MATKITPAMETKVREAAKNGVKLGTIAKELDLDGHRIKWLYYRAELEAGTLPKLEPTGAEAVRAFRTLGLRKERIAVAMGLPASGKGIRMVEDLLKSAKVNLAKEQVGSGLGARHFGKDAKRNVERRPHGYRAPRAKKVAA